MDQLHQLFQKAGAHHLFEIVLKLGLKREARNRRKEKKQTFSGLKGEEVGHPATRGPLAK